MGWGRIPPTPTPAAISATAISAWKPRHRPTPEPMGSDPSPPHLRRPGIASSKGTPRSRIERGSAGARKNTALGSTRWFLPQSPVFEEKKKEKSRCWTHFSPVAHFNKHGCDERKTGRLALNERVSPTFGGPRTAVGFFLVHSLDHPKGRPVRHSLALPRLVGSPEAPCCHAHSVQHKQIPLRVVEFRAVPQAPLARERAWRWIGFGASVTYLERVVGNLGMRPGVGPLTGNHQLDGL